MNHEFQLQILPHLQGQSMTSFRSDFLQQKLRQLRTPRSLLRQVRRPGIREEYDYSF